jgi:sec-independent protein translocase protein TatC
MLELKVAFVLAVMIALPVILYQVWGHLSPILQAHERRVLLPGLFVAVLLFGVGVFVGWLVLPISLRWAFSFQTEYVTAVINADDYFSFATRLLLAFGVVFEMPIVLMILTTLGIVTPKFLKDKRRHAIAIIAVLSALITPGDVASMFLMMIPMVILYEVSIYLSIIISRGDSPDVEEAEPEEAEPDPHPVAGT